jgi:hypothetical protein
MRDCLVLYEIFRSEKIDFALYQKLRRKKQIRSLRLSMILENVMRPKPLWQNLLFSALRVMSKSAIFVKHLSIR